MAPANQPTRTVPKPPLCPASGWPHLRSWPLPELSNVVDRILLRLLCRIASRQIALIDGWIFRALTADWDAGLHQRLAV
jgi:hypothetical protein